MVFWRVLQLVLNMTSSSNTIMPWWHRLCLLCAIVLLFLSSNVLAAPRMAASTAQLYQSNPQLLLNHHNSALEAAQGAAIRHEKLSKGHDEKSEANHISDDAAYNHQYAASDHEKISEQLKTNAAYHRKRIAEIKSGHHDAAGDYHEEFKKIRASRKLSADADEHAKHAENISKGMEGHEKAILSHKCKKSSPEYKACVDGRREAKRTYDSESEKASKHAATLKVGSL